MNYGELKTEIEGFAHRNDVPVESFIRIAHSMIVDDIQFQSSDVDYTFLEQDWNAWQGNIWLADLPAGVHSVRLVASNGKTLESLPLEKLISWHQARTSGGPAQNWSLMGRQLLVGPGLGEITMIYEERAADFVNDNDTNEILTNYPGIYIYGSLLHLHKYVQDDEQAQICAGLYDGEVERARVAQWNLRAGGAPAMIGVS